MPGSVDVEEFTEEELDAALGAKRRPPKAAGLLKDSLGVTVDV
jgi:hypothetical protein